MGTDDGEHGLDCRTAADAQPAQRQPADPATPLAGTEAAKGAAVLGGLVNNQRPIGDREARRTAEQETIEDRGGIKKLDIAEMKSHRRKEERDEPQK